MSVFLLGYRGSGKTTIGKRLADRLWQPFVDTDEMIVKRAGMTIKEIFERQGEDKFRDLETDVVKEVAGLDEHVIALGGGAVLREQNRDALKSKPHKLIYLRCDAKVLRDRIHGDANTAATRPNLTSLGGSIEEIEQLLAIREPIYRQCMTAELEVTNLTPEDAVVYIARLI